MTNEKDKVYNNNVNLEQFIISIGDENMAISYNRLWKLLIDRKMSTAELRKAAEIAPNTLTRMKRDQEVTMQVLERICEVLHADFGDIVEYLSDEDEDGER